ncbi:MAG: HIT domain-containing protein [Deltaproteobacteria bacterium]|nr:HIT domain-containing protein [Deltaproteobacteria bacterium]
MNRLWAPWRAEYVQSGEKAGCIFCVAANSASTADNHVLYAGRLSVVMMNKFPYNSGHLLIAPARHVGDLPGLTDEEAADSHKLIVACLGALSNVYKPHGFNIGLNLGRAAGAGIEAHLHTHVVPRWNGDVNFMPVLSDVKVMPEHIAAAYEKLKPFFSEKP